MIHFDIPFFKLGLHSFESLYYTLATATCSFYATARSHRTYKLKKKRNSRPQEEDHGLTLAGLNSDCCTEPAFYNRFFSRCS
jgi:hypothetical protein